MKKRWLVCVPALLVAGPAWGQVHDVPTFRTPYGETGYGLYLIFQERSDVGALFTWRRAGADLDLGVRAGLMERSGEAGFLVGVELGNDLVRADEEFPLDVAWVSGVGVGTVPALDLTVLRIPFGVSLGRRAVLDDGGTVLLPYVHPRIALDVIFRDAPPPGTRSTSTRLHADVDLGMDLQLTGTTFLRLGVTLGRNDAVGLGLSF